MTTLDQFAERRAKAQLGIAPDAVIIGMNATTAVLIGAVVRRNVL